ncbi:ferrous iron transport protein B [Blattabacterium cuenoti]|uniref:ferrous iron transport protein B n=1 Tax=Blattabacterium cuenoti TaxID=1653831 RepID=UPI00163CF1EF|nr:ferrous iron transport protein B [Blattabacterium cuenoti]
MNNKIRFVKLALIGNPNVGKTCLFNNLTGLNQKVGNYSGVTVEKKVGYFSFEKVQYQVIDLPGTYSIYPSSEDEEIVCHLLNDEKNHVDSPDKIIVVADSSNIRKSIFLFSQIQDLGFPVLFILNMMDQAKKKGVYINVKKLKNILSSEIICIDARKRIGLEKLKNKIKNLKKKESTSLFFCPRKIYYDPIHEVKNIYNINNTYKAWLYLSNNKIILNNNIHHLKEIKKKYNISSRKLQIKETLDRYEKIGEILSKSVLNIVSNHKKNILEFSKKLDNYVILHPFWGYFIFLFILFFIFQCIFFWSDHPKILIEYYFSIIRKKLENIYPGPLNDFLLQGILPGISAVISFIPQIFILLFFLLIMEESGYISRVIFLMDRIMRPFGLNGKSIVPLISSIACAIPAIMSARHIENSRDRLITILATPFITCSARLPVYTLIISLIIPNKKWYFIQLKGIVLMGMYLIGILSALTVSMLLHKLLRKNYRSHLIMEMPTYKIPIFRNIWIPIWINLKSFIINVGKMILLVNIIIWVLGNFGPSNNNVVNNNNKWIIIQKSNLPNSYLGILGKNIEPLLHPLGYNWKIGIGILSSLVAREVFVSTMTSVYNIEKKENVSLNEKMKNDSFSETKKPIATGLSILSFYAFSMQCMSTLSIIKKETKSWKWPVIQFVFMTILAYVTSFIIYQTLK